MAYIKNVADTPIIPLAEARRFIADCLVAVGATKEVGEAQARLLVEADSRGHFSHGMNRLEMYIEEIQGGMCDPKGMPVIKKESPATAWVDGNNGMGAVCGIFCMELAIKKAKEVGVGWVTSRNCNHNGIEAMYCLMAVKEGCLGMAFTNTSPLLSPTRAKGASLGTNPIGMGAPGIGTDCFLLDIATSAVALGKIELQKRKNQPIPEGWAEDENGKTTTDADVALKAECLMPLGGSEENSGYKGTGLAILVEILCGVTSGSHMGPWIRKWRSAAEAADLGQCYIAMNPDCFADGFPERCSKLLNYIRNMEPADPTKPVFIPGDFERGNMLEADKIGGVRYFPNQLETCAKLSSSLNVDMLKDIDGKPATSGGKSGGAGGKVCTASCAKTP